MCHGNITQSCNEESYNNKIYQLLNCKKKWQGWATHDANEMGKIGNVLPNSRALPAHKVLRSHKFSFFVFLPEAAS